MYTPSFRNKTDENERAAHSSDLRVFSFGSSFYIFASQEAKAAFVFKMATDGVMKAIAPHIFHFQTADTNVAFASFLVNFVVIVIDGQGYGAVSCLMFLHY